MQIKSDRKERCYSTTTTRSNINIASAYYVDVVINATVVTGAVAFAIMSIVGAAFFVGYNVVAPTLLGKLDLLGSSNNSSSSRASRQLCVTFPYHDSIAKEISLKKNDPSFDEV
jgi:hypothetical protein